MRVAESPAGAIRGDRAPSWTERLRGAGELRDAPLGRRLGLLAVSTAAVVAAAGCGIWLSGGGAWGSVRAGLATAVAADPALGLGAAVGFVVSLAATALAFRVAFRALGAHIDRLDACARYSVGSLVNTFLPGGLGDGVRTALFARSLPRRQERVLSAAGALASIAVCRALLKALAIGSGSALGVVPLWPALGLGGGAAVAAAAVLLLHRRGTSRRLSRLSRLIEASTVLLRSPRLGLSLLVWSSTALAGRFLAAVAAVAAVGVARPLLAALAITAALEIAGAVPITPGGVGITTGAISLALVSRGTTLSAGLAAGLVYHAVETAASLVFAAACLGLARRPGRSHAGVGRSRLPQPSP